MLYVGSGRFLKRVKKSHRKEKNKIKEIIQEIVDNPEIGELKKGDLSGIRVYKFRCNNQQYLISYSIDEDDETIYFYTVGSHQNYYRELKKYLKS